LDDDAVVGVACADSDVVATSVEGDVSGDVASVSFDDDPQDARNVTPATRHRRRFVAGRRMSS